MTTTSPPKPWQASSAGASTTTQPLPANNTGLTSTNSGALTTSANANSRLKPWEREASGGRLDDLTSATAVRRPTDSNFDSAYSNTPYSSRYGSSLGSRYGSGYGGYGSSYGSGYGGYGSSYGSGYGSGYGSSYGGSSYGGYGSSYGGYGGYGSSSSYGSGYGGYGSGYGDYGSSYGGGGYGGYGEVGWGNNQQLGKYGPPMAGGMWQGAANQGFQLVNGLHSVTAGFGRFAGLLDANSQAMHGALSSIVRLIENAGFLYREIGFALSGFTLVRLIQRLLRKILGRSSANTNNGSAGALQAVNEFQKENGVGTSHTRFWVTFLAAIISCAFFGVPIISRLLGRWLGPEDDQQKLDDAWNGNRPTALTQLRVLHDYPSQNERELPLRAGDIINVTQKPFEAWWEGEIQGQPGRLGLFPTNYTQPLNAAPQTEPLPQ